MQLLSRASHSPPLDWRDAGINVLNTADAAGAVEEWKANHVGS
ncbi:MAG: hypothetical protein AAGA03_12100 [Planctomycetota bacterium]